jgi:hypothetical protein
MEKSKNTEAQLITLSPIHLNKNNYSFETDINLYNFLEGNGINDSLSLVSILDTPIDAPKFSVLDLMKFDDKNQNSDLISKDTSNSVKDKKLDTKIGQKVKREEKENYSNDNLLRRAKTILFDSLLKYDNYIISKVYNDHIGNGVNIKKLLKINHSQIKNINANYNRDLIKTSQGKIFSENISKRHTYYPEDHNKRLINKLLNENDDDKRKTFVNLFSKTLKECIQHITGQKIEELKGLERFYENEINELEEGDEFKKEIKKFIDNYETILLTLFTNLFYFYKKRIKIL